MLLRDVVELVNMLLVELQRDAKAVDDYTRFLINMQICTSHSMFIYSNNKCKKQDNIQ